MQYSTSDLLNKAKSLADCANTDFLTETDCEQMLNEAYSEVYQIAINRGCDDFVKVLKSGNSETPLPKDFYSLRAVKSPNGYVYKRRPLDATANETGYSIINGKLIVTGSLPTGAEITYYPLPKHLTYQYPEKQLGFKDGSYTVFDNNGHFFVYWYREGQGIHAVEKLVINDMLNDTSIETVIDYEPTDIECSKSTFFAFSGNSVYEYDYDGNAIAAQGGAPNYGPIKTRTGYVKFAQWNGLSKKLTYDGKEYLLEFEEPLRTLDRIVVGINHFYYIDTAGTLYEYEMDSQEAIVIDTNVSNKFLKAKDVDKEDGVLYYKNAPMIFSRGLDRGEHLDQTRQVIDCDFTHFYGFTDRYVLYGDGLNVHAIGNLPDVVMNYPNNTFYELIAYAIATRLVAKQGGDASILSSQWLQAMQNFYDQSQDAFQVTRITNVYR